MAPFLMRDRFHNNGIAKKPLILRTKTMKKKAMQERFKRLKTEMKEISEEQKNIRQGQRQVREKFEAIESDCEQLKRQTKMMIQQSAITQVKLAIMFKILKSREDGDFSTAAKLCQLLRQIVGREKQGSRKLELGDFNVT
ncbi:hypothetical protein REPUB_Repub01dG0267100 [Reevesia pubescens]